MSYGVLHELLKVQTEGRSDTWKFVKGLEPKLRFLHEEKKAKDQLEPIVWLLQQNHYE